MTDIQRAKWEEFAKNYKTDNWGYTGREQTMQSPIGPIRILKMPSGTLYELKGDTRIKIDKKWFDKMELLAAQLKMKQQADEDNGIVLEENYATTTNSTVESAT